MCGAIPITLIGVLILATRAHAGEWRAELEENGTLTLSRDDSPVVRCTPVFFGQDWQWAGAPMTALPRGEGRWALAGSVPKLGVSITGDLSRVGPRDFRAAYRTTVSRDLRGVIGGGFEFSVAYNAPVLGGGAGEPKLIPGRRGWVWDTGGGRELRVEFDRAIARIYFERGDPSRIRAFFLDHSAEVGEHAFTMTASLPPGTRWARGAWERYGPEDLDTWHRGALPDDLSPLDASFLNADDRPAGSRGSVRVEGDRLVFADGSPARFWGTNVTAGALFDDRESIRTQARRIAELGYNLVRLHHHDSSWVRPNVLNPSRPAGGLLDPQAIDRIDWWVKCLKERGVYTWLDLHVGRAFTKEEAPSGYASLNSIMRCRIASLK